MITSLRRLRGLARHRHSADYNDRRDLLPFPQFAELSRASQDMQDMRECYDSLFSVAQATANSAYEFSESLREMGACLLQKTALCDDAETGKVLLMLGKVQFELQKLVDCYRSHICQTITIPSESLLNELHTVEEMKRQCDEKREVYECMLMRQKERGRGRIGKGESATMQQLQAAHDAYDDEATLLVFRLKSLKQGQSRSLLTQAARHHAAQLCLFKKALKSLEAVESHVKSVTEQQHIDYHFSGLEDDDGDDVDDGDDSDDEDDTDDAHDDGELSFDYRQSDCQVDVSTSRQSMELDLADITFPQVATLEATKENVYRGHRKSFSLRGEIRTASQSAPLFAESKYDPADKMKQMQPSATRKFNTYVLPTPVDTISSNSMGSGSPVPCSLKTSLSGHSNYLWHSSPLETKKCDKHLGDEKFPGSATTNVHTVLRESDNNTVSTHLPPPLADGLLFSWPDPLVASESKKVKRYAFSGPMAHKPSPTKRVSVEDPQLFSGPLLQTPMSQLLQSIPGVSPKASPKGSPGVSRSASPTFLSSPKISELHELPRPPTISFSKSSRSLGLVGHSAPLVPKGQILPVTRKPIVANAASPLPTPSQVTRSFSIPSSGLRVMALNAAKPLETTGKADMVEMVGSPPLTPISLSNIQPSSTGPETANLVAK